MPEETKQTNPDIETRNTSDFHSKDEIVLTKVSSDPTKHQASKNKNLVVYKNLIQQLKVAKRKSPDLSPKKHRAMFKSKYYKNSSPLKTNNSVTAPSHIKTSTVHHSGKSTMHKESPSSSIKTPGTIINLMPSPNQ